MTDERTSGSNDANNQGKGAPTPKRSEAEAARKSQMKKPVTRKEQNARERERRNKERAKQRDALFGEGSAKDLPPRDQGPSRAVARDVVDRRRTVAEYMLPVLVFVLCLSFIQTDWAPKAVTSIWFTIFVLLVVDTLMLARQLKRALAEKVGPNATKGHTMYALMRSTQLRRFRLPKPALKIGEPLKQRY